MACKRVVITGIGLLTPIGTGVSEFWNSVLAGKSGLSFVDRYDTSQFRCKIGGLINNFNPLDYVRNLNVETMDRSSHFGIAAIKLALKDAGIEDQRDWGCYSGIAVGGADYGEKSFLQYRNNKNEVLKHFFIGNVPNGLLVTISQEFAFKGKSAVISNGCTTSTDSIGLAYKTISLGISQDKIIIAGGAEAPITPYTTVAFDNIRALSPYNEHPPSKASRPFDKNRNGFIASEGGSFLVLEELENALSRKAKIYAEIIGYGSTADASHMTRPHEDGHYSIKAMTKALKDANLNPDQIDYINAHGSSTKLNDKIETMVIKSVYGDHAKKLLVSSTKSMVGHMLGAAGAMEIATTALGIYYEYAPPTINYETPDPDCDLNYVPNQAVKKEIKYATSNSAGFGGLNSVVVLKKYAK